MIRKTRRTVEREAKRHGARVVDWEEGQKHMIACILAASGDIIEFSVPFGAADDVKLKRWVRLRLKATP